MNTLFNISSKNRSADVNISQLSCVGGVEEYVITVEYPDVCIPSPITLTFEEEMKNVFTFWSPTANKDKGLHQWFHPNNSVSRFCFGAPVICAIGDKDENVLTVALSDTVTPVNMSFCVNDLAQKEKLNYSIRLFDGICNPTKKYVACLRLDRRTVKFYSSLSELSAWWQSHGVSFRAMPDAAEDALYSSWYNFHQAPEQQKLLDDLEIAAGLGFKTVILDDGWQFDGPSTGDYALCGEWQVAKSKFPDFAGFTRRVHELGMKLMIWFTVPFIGVESPTYAKFEGKYLYVDNGCRAGVLDPRYREVRDYLAGICKNFRETYGTDGFKLDFIDSFRAGDLTAAYNPDTMDCETVDAGVMKLLSEITEAMPGLLYEYRQNYVGAEINSYGNMLRVGDCAYDSVSNRMCIADLRMLGYPTAVHSDMLYWAHDERPELCARQLLNVMFAVPQISVILGNIPEAQRAVIKNYLDYWTENRAILLHGSFSAKHPELNYTELTADGPGKRITVLYAAGTVSFDGKRTDVFNNGECDFIIVENVSGKDALVSVYDCYGNAVAESTLKVGEIKRVNTPICAKINIVNF